MAVRMMNREARPSGSYGDYGLTEKDYGVTFTGAVLGTYEENGYNDSDFYAVVWDEDAGQLRSVKYGTTRSWTYANNAVADATEEVLDKARAWLGRVQGDHAVADAMAEAVIPERGRRVRVVKGRKVAVGTEGEVFWTGVDNYKSSRWATFYRVGFRTDDGEEYFTAEENVEVVGAAEYLPGTVEEIRERARERCARMDAAGIISYYRGVGLAFNARALAHREAAKRLAVEFGVADQEVH